MKWLPCDVCASLSSVRLMRRGVCIFCLLISIWGSVQACLCVSYWFNFHLYATVNGRYLNKATEAHKNASVEIVDLVKFLLTFEEERADGQWQGQELNRKSYHSFPSVVISLKSYSHCRWNTFGVFLCDISLKIDLKDQEQGTLYKKAKYHLGGDPVNYTHPRFNCSQPCSKFSLSLISFRF